MASLRRGNSDDSDGNRKRTNPGDLDGSYDIIVITATDKISGVKVEDSDTISQIQRKIQDKKKSGSSTLMNIFIKNIKGKITYYLEVSPSDTIGNVKAKMSDFAHMLVYNGVALEDSCTLDDLNINDGSILTRIDTAPNGKIEILVHTFTKKTISLSVTSTDTIANMKLWIMYKEGVPVKEQMLIFNGMALRDSEILSNFDIHGQSTLTLVRRSRGRMKIFVKTFEGKVITVKVKPSNTIGDVKSKIQGQVDVPHDEQELIFDETVLDNIDIVADCNINEESTLTLVRLSAGYMNIFIRSQSGRTITMDVYGNDFDRVRFIFEGRQMMDGSTLADCHVQNESIIHSALTTIRVD
ncbi:uncharacterized protein LOC143589175 [Bidens hawaiensis]|uniref:uncharacterized protein LOC143589175 n=1 Tax=Bidens hawaiensis TaxID=980011 RepID=UPI00404B3146